MAVKAWIDGTNPGDYIERGRIVKVAYEGRFGQIFRALKQGLIDKELEGNQRNEANKQPFSSDRILGRIEGYRNIENALMAMIDEGEKAEQPIEEEDQEDEDLMA